MISDFVESPSLATALAAIILMAITSGLLSPLLVSKRLAFMGEAIAHSTLLGLALGHGPFAALGVLGSALVVTLFLAGLLAWSVLAQRLPSDTLIGLFLTVSMALGVIAHQQFAQGQSDLLALLFGNILLLKSSDIFGLLAVTGLTVIALLALKRQWMAYIFDAAGSRLAGVKIVPLHFFFFILLTFFIVLAVKLAGVVLVNSLLLMPGAFALSLGRTPKQVIIFSLFFSVLSSVLGLGMANHFNLPPGAALAVIQFLLLIISLKIRKKA